MSTTALEAGQPITTHEQMEELPVGSVICETGRQQNAWEKRDDGLWYGINGRNGSGPYTPPAFSMEGYNSVFSRPGEPPPPPPQETLLQFMWKFRENAISGAHENSVSMEATMKGMRLLGLDREWELGPGVRFKVLDNQLAIPDGVVIANVNHNDPKHQHYTLFARRRSQWHTLLGRSGLGRDGVVVEWPGVSETPAWWTEVGDEEAGQEVARFKARAWRIGQQIKSEQSWCGTYEHVIARVGVTRASVREALGAGGYDVGDRISQNHAAAMPEGTLFIYRSDTWTNHWAVYQRDNSADNMTRTRRIAGHKAENGSALGHYQSTMIVLSIPVEETTPWTIDQGHVQPMLELLPVGVVFTYSTAQYIKCQDNRFTDWRRGTRGIPVTGMHYSHSFSGASIIINHFEEQA